MITITVWLIFLLCLGVLFCREVLNFGEAKRSGVSMERHYKLFRRRTKGLLVFLLFGFCYQLGLYIEESLEPKQRLVYFSMYFMQLIWILILVARDFHEIARSYSLLKEQVTVESLESIGKDVEDNKPIPLINHKGKSD